MNNNFIQNIYDSLWDSAISRLSDNNPECDVFLNRKEIDSRRGLTVILRPDEKVLSEFCGFLNEGRQIEPGQYYYDSRDIHITVLSIISCYDGFKLENINLSKYLDVLNKAVKESGPVTITFKGVTASNSCVMIQGYPLDGNLENLRSNIRKGFADTGLVASIDKRYTLLTAHSTVIRFCRPLSCKDRFISYLNKYRGYEFGTVKLNKLDFCINDWYMSNEISKTIATFDLIG